MIRIQKTPAVIERLHTGGPQIFQALIVKMNELMIRLQGKVIGESIPEFFPKGAPNITASVRLEPTHAEGTKIVGAVLAGGIPRTTTVTLRNPREFDIAVLQEGGVAHGWDILPFSKKALAFQLDGKQLIRRRVFHPGLHARPFMRAELQNMESEIIGGLKESVEGLLNG